MHSTLAPAVSAASKLEPMPAPLRLSFVTGTEPDKWFTRYRDQVGELSTVDSGDALADVLAGEADLALARVPVKGGDPRITEDFHLVRLYEEAPGVAVPKDHVLAELGEEVDPRDLADESVNYRIPDDAVVDVQAVRDALQIVGANVGIAIAPRPLLKVLSKRQVVPLALADVADGATPPTPRTQIALVWPKDKDSDEIQGFVAVSRGRTAQSSRGTAQKLSAREKTLAKLARREAAARGAGGATGKSTGKPAGKGGKTGHKPQQNQTLSKRKKGSGRGKRR